VTVSILVTNSKGGCGKTTLATNLASAFANAGFATGLADVDRQRSSLGWLARRPGSAAPIVGLDWRKAADKPALTLGRLVIDAPAGLRLGHVEALLKAADVVVVPVLASVFDAASTTRFLAKLERIKPIAKGKKSVLLVANRQRHRQRAAQRLLDHLAEAGLDPVASLSDRALYADLASDGLGLFDVTPSRAAAARADWLPLLQAIEEESSASRM
jgi:chromosome partitioning protein